jgi:hypothetical protein
MKNANFSATICSQADGTIPINFLKENIASFAPRNEHNHSKKDQ